MNEHITDRDQRAWQQRTLKLLSRLLEVRDLPVLEWTVSDVGARLRGRVKLKDFASRASRGRAAADFETWRRYLEATIASDFTTMGTRHVTAVAERYDGHVRVMLMVDLPTDDDLVEQEEGA